MRLPHFTGLVGEVERRKIFTLIPGRDYYSKVWKYFCSFNMYVKKTPTDKQKSQPKRCHTKAQMECFNFLLLKP